MSFFLFLIYKYPQFSLIFHCFSILLIYNDDNIKNQYFTLGIKIQSIIKTVAHFFYSKILFHFSKISSISWWNRQHII